VCGAGGRSQTLSAPQAKHTPAKAAKPKSSSPPVSPDDGEKHYEEEEDRDAQEKDDVIEVDGEEDKGSDSAKRGVPQLRRRDWPRRSRARTQRARSGASLQRGPCGRAGG
jgi:hypothetical protein